MYALSQYAAALKRMPLRAMMITVIRHVNETTALGISLLFFTAD
jgi:hypothetical protein